MKIARLRWLACLVAVAAATGGAGQAQPAPAQSAQVAATTTATAATTTTTAVTTIPQGAAPRALPGLSASEANADAAWKLRSGLNVAALQCQFSPFLATVPVYNAFLRQHSDELSRSFRTLLQYFVRQQGRRAGDRAFDTYATRANQSWATFDGKLSFCDAAALIGRRALAVPKGRFAEFAIAEVPLLRQSLQQAGTPEAFRLHLEWPSLPDIAACRRGKRCP